MNVAVIADKYLATGYRLAGIHPIPVRDIEEAVERFKEATQERRFDLILVPEGYAKRLKEEAKLMESSRQGPIISVIPDFKGLTKGRAGELYELISQAVGTKLKMEE